LIADFRLSKKNSHTSNEGGREELGSSAVACLRRRHGPDASG